MKSYTHTAEAFCRFLAKNLNLNLYISSDLLISGNGMSCDIENKSDAYLSPKLSQKFIIFLSTLKNKKIFSNVQFFDFF